MDNTKDPRVLFAAERTLLAWNRTSLALMAFGFAIERFGLFLQMFGARQGEVLQRGLSFWIGIAFIVLGSGASLASIVQYQKVVRTPKPIEIPEGYRTNLGVLIRGIVGILGAALILYLFLHEIGL